MGPTLAVDYAAEMTTTKETVLATSWQDLFVAAVEPSDGWPTRPWDHRYVEDERSVVRVAVDQSGGIVLDADGDEVQSGPGFDHGVAKVQRGSPVTERGAMLPSDLLTTEMQAMLNRAERLSAVFGHCWIGTEHLALALVEESSLARAVVGATWDVLAEGVCQFYEGPYAAARMRLVSERLKTDWMPRPVARGVASLPNQALEQLVQASREAAEGAGREADVALVAGELVAPGNWALVSRLLER